MQTVAGSVLALCAFAYATGSTAAQPPVGALGSSLAMT